MFDDDDPFLLRVRDLAARFPDSKEKVSHGRPAFYTKKVFAYYGGSLKEDGQWVQHPRSLVFLAEPDERPALVSDRRFYIPAYVGPSGWVGVDLDENSDWDEVSELMEVSYRLTAPKRSIVQLDPGA